MLEVDSASMEVGEVLASTHALGPIGWFPPSRSC